MNRITENRGSGAWIGRIAGVAIFLALLGAIVYGTGYFQGTVSPAEQDREIMPAGTGQDMTAAWARSDWPGVETICRDLIEKDQFNPTARFNLAFSLHRLGRLEEATEHYLLARDFVEYQGYSDFNLATIFAGDGKTDLAIRHLTQALESGFVSSRGIDRTPELKPLYAHDSFADLVEQENRNRVKRERRRRR